MLSVKEWRRPYCFPRKETARSRIKSFGLYAVGRVYGDCDSVGSVTKRLTRYSLSASICCSRRVQERVGDFFYVNLLVVTPVPTFVRPAVLYITASLSIFNGPIVKLIALALFFYSFIHSFIHFIHSFIHSLIQ